MKPFIEGERYSINQGLKGFVGDSDSEAVEDSMDILDGLSEPPALSRLKRSGMDFNQSHKRGMPKQWERKGAEEASRILPPR